MKNTLLITLLASMGGVLFGAESNPLRPRAFGGKGAEGMKKEIPSNFPPQIGEIRQKIVDSAGRIG
jgi:hypothetical protein